MEDLRFFQPWHPEVFTSLFVGSVALSPCPHPAQPLAPSPPYVERTRDPPFLSCR